ncbi:hypothetical protein ACOXVJ_15255 [Pseudomonas knackmussii]|uniref:hypothetical protein n=1 Tax=Pseudomonas knackmussii TaxID=65741 RepID=UPI003BCCE4A4
MRRAWLGGLLLGLAGCQSPGALKEEVSVSSVQTLKSPPVYRDCLLPKRRAYRSGTEQVEVRYGYRLVLPDSAGQPGALLEVGANERGSLVSLYQRPDVDSVLAERSLRECL